LFETERREPQRRRGEKRAKVKTSGFDIFSTGQVGERSSHFQNAAIGSGTQTEFVDRGFQ
jgi:hypothetical protein